MGKTKKPTNEKWEELVEYVEMKIMTTDDPIEVWIRKWLYDEDLEITKEQLDYLIHHAKHYRVNMDKSLH